MILMLNIGNVLRESHLFVLN
ncbi:Protein of unknown function [Bacillus mycoides]|nr:Protein of unknown function [Bacillus mycoides]